MIVCANNINNNKSYDHIVLYIVSLQLMPPFISGLNTKCFIIFVSLRRLSCWTHRVTASWPWTIWETPPRSAICTSPTTRCGRWYKTQTSMARARSVWPTSPTWCYRPADSSTRPDATLGRRSQLCTVMSWMHRPESLVTINIDQPYTKGVVKIIKKQIP